MKGSWGRTARRAGSLCAAVAAFSLATAGTASAHFCYKDWQDAAYRHHVNGGTAWMPLSDMGVLITQEMASEMGADLDLSCAHTATDALVVEFMDEFDMTQEPLIHSRALVAGGALKNGKSAGPIKHLTDEQFGFLEVHLFDYVGGCLSFPE